MKNHYLDLVVKKQIESSKIYQVPDDKAEKGEKKKKDVPREIDAFEIGDTVDVHQLILEGEKVREQVFSGVVIGRAGEGMNEMFTVRRIVQGEGVERIFPLHSPRVAKLKVKRTGQVRRAKLYYLRKRVGKATRLRERKAKTGEVLVPGAQGAEKKGRKKAEQKASS